MQNTEVVPRFWLFSCLSAL